MKVAGEHHSIRHGRKASVQLLLSIGWSVEVPKVFNLVRIEPRFDVCEKTTFDLMSWPQTAHKFENPPTVLLADFLGRIKTESKIVIAPDTNCCHVTKQGDDFLHSLSHFAYIAKNNEAVGSMPS